MVSGDLARGRVGGRTAWRRRATRRAEHGAGVGGDAARRSALAGELGRLEHQLVRMEEVHGPDIAAVHPDHRTDAVNLVHYVALRHQELRRLQRDLGELGLSSLGRCEPHVLATVASVRDALGGPPLPVPAGLSFSEGRRALDRNTDALFGSRPPGRVSRVMVTLPTEAATDYGLVRRLVVSGMDVARINGAHDDVEVWTAMAAHVRRASADVGRPCRLSVDLPGPKLRTGPLRDGPRVVRLRPRRDRRGVPAVPVTVTLVAGTDGLPAGAVPVDARWLARRRTGDVVTLDDTRGSHRQLRVTDVGAGRLEAELWDTTYLETGSRLRCGSDGTVVGTLPPLAEFHLLAPGDALLLTPDLVPAEPWCHGQPGLARIGCTLPAAVAAARPGEQVLFDDGRIGGVVESATPEGLLVRVTAAAPDGSRLRAEKGINLPDTDLQAAVVSDADLTLLRLAAAEADILGLSFVRTGRDVDDVRGYLARVGGTHLGLMVKVETGTAFAHLPEVLLHAMRAPRVGVMIARGDLAVEAGYERLAEVQEEIMWLCEAAHLPVVWATEVLDRLSRTGKPSRAEVTDAAMAQRAECVMLNKGPHVDTAIAVLDDILRRMSGHQRKKTPLLRPLRSWDGT